MGNTTIVTPIPLDCINIYGVTYLPPYMLVSFTETTRVTHVTQSKIKTMKYTFTVLVKIYIEEPFYHCICELVTQVLME